MVVVGSSGVGTAGRRKISKRDGTHGEEEVDQGPENAEKEEEEEVVVMEVV